MDENQVQLGLDRRTALLLFDWLADRPEEKDAALKVALWQLEGALESTLVEIVEHDYKAKVEQAEKELRAMAGEG